MRFFNIYVCINRSLTAVPEEPAAKLLLWATDLKERRPFKTSSTIRPAAMYCLLISQNNVEYKIIYS